jgi:hypothetical protein
MISKTAIKTAVPIQTDETRTARTLSSRLGFLRDFFRRGLGAFGCGTGFFSSLTGFLDVCLGVLSTRKEHKFKKDIRQ